MYSIDRTHHRTSRKIYKSILGAGLFLVIIGGGYFGWKKLHNNTQTFNADTYRYVSLGGGYIFTVPAQYTADGTALPGATLIYPKETDATNGKSLNDLFAAGAVAVQTITELKDNNPEAFNIFVKDVIAADLRKVFKSPTDTRPAKQTEAEALEVYVLGPNGKRLRANYAINFTQPIIVAAQERSDAFVTVSLSMEDLKKSRMKTDVDQAAQAAKEIAEKVKGQKGAELIKTSTTEFKKQKTNEELASMLKESTAYLDRPLTIVGGLFNNQYFIAQLVFEPSAQTEQPTVGIISLRKNGKTWELDGLQLPK